ncbi:putative mitochondrial protein [Cucumis melo var. makuwa]|uniref:Mitochondrial protein n=1 Tax=Cucumis melo var. makuwa TaxID=1194695 RepID=A0A5D3DCY8_CUCMM|nr:putative mitochondrial protein [Cucumis melo var. makuwa]TYK21527.1 putative mitochondrial protein [Cucumis melo var. makuwa]
MINESVQSFFSEKRYSILCGRLTVRLIAEATGTQKYCDMLSMGAVRSSLDVGNIGRTRAGCKIMEIIRYEPSASRSPVLDEVDWTDAEEQASVGNARALNAIFNGTTIVKTSRLQLITSKFETLKMVKDESVSDYNERVLEIANESLLLGEKIPEPKIDAWYFDSGCSRHMTGNRSFFSELKECTSGHVTFGDGVRENSKAYKVFNNRSGTVMETINVVVNDSEYTNKRTVDEDDELPTVTIVLNTTFADAPKADTQTNSFDISSKSTPKEITVEETKPIPSSHVRKNHPSSSIIGDPSTGITTKKKDKVDYLKMIIDLCYTFLIKPTSVDAALKDEYWINAMQEELLQFRCNNYGLWVCNQEQGTLVAQGYAQVEGVDFDETFAPLVRLEAIRLLPGYSRGGVDKTLFINITDNDLIVAQIYIDDIIFGGFPKELVDNFIDIMKSEFKMSIVDVVLFSGTTNQT